MSTTSSPISSHVQRLLRGFVLPLLVCGAVWGSALAGNTPPVKDLILGRSTQGRSIDAVRIGNGPRKLVVVGATHGWPERNTYELSLQLIGYFRGNPDAVPSSVSLYIVPLLNPDGMQLRSRWNANDVDLNRNMNTSADGCPENDWRHRVNGAYGSVSNSGGPYSESEIESRLIRDFLLDADGAIFFHSYAGVVFPACDHSISTEMAKVYADASDYKFTPTWDRYLITGGMPDWAGGLGIASITPELLTGERAEFDQNVAGIMAVLENADSLLSEPEPREVFGVEVQPIIWRAWQAWGGEEMFGKPLAPAEETPDGWTQLFEKARFEYRPAQTESRSVVQISSLGQEIQSGSSSTTSRAPGSSAEIEPTAPVKDQVFATFWQRYGAQPIFGEPIGEAEETQDVDGRPIIRQPFQRAVMERPADATDLSNVRLLPLGRIMWARDDATSEQSSVRAR